jgi:hypothetical protein
LYRQGAAGEKFVVAADKPKENKIFLLSRAENKQLIALYVPHSSVVSLKQTLQSSAYLESVFSRVESGELDTLGKLRARAKEDPVQAGLVTRLQGLTDLHNSASTEFERLTKETETEFKNIQSALAPHVSEMENLKRRVNDPKFADRISYLKREIEKHEARQKNYAATAKQRLLESVKKMSVQICALHEFATELKGQEAYTEAFSVAKYSDSLAQQFRTNFRDFNKLVENPNPFPFERLKTVVGKARVLRAEFRLAFQENDFEKARTLATEALSLEPGSYITRALLRENILPENGLAKSEPPSKGEKPREVVPNPENSEKKSPPPSSNAEPPKNSQAAPTLASTSTSQGPTSTPPSASKSQPEAPPDVATSANSDEQPFLTKWSKALKTAGALLLFIVLMKVFFRK